MDCVSLHLDLSSLSWENVWQTQCEEKAWLTVVCLTVLCSAPHYGCICLVWVCKLKSFPSFTNVEDFNVACTSIPTTDCSVMDIGGRKHYGKWISNGFHMKIVTIMNIVYGCMSSSYPRRLLTGIGSLSTYKRLRAKSVKLSINTYLANCERWTSILCNVLDSFRTSDSTEMVR